MYNSIGVDFHLFLYFQRNEQILDLCKNVSASDVLENILHDEINLISSGEVILE